MAKKRVTLEGDCLHCDIVTVLRNMQYGEQDEDLTYRITKLCEVIADIASTEFDQGNPELVGYALRTIKGMLKEVLQDEYKVEAKDRVLQ